jgi:hypothetical protein
MSPESESNIFLGPPSLSKLAREASCDGNLESEPSEVDSTDISDCIVFFINEATQCQSPQVEIKVADRIGINATLDSGSEVNLLAERVYDKLIKSCVDITVLPVESVALVTAFGKRSKRIRYQTLINSAVGNDLFESVFLVSSQLTNEAIIGCQLLKEYGASINFGRGTFSYVRSGVLREYTFAAKAELQKVTSNDRRETGDSVIENNSYTGQ